MINEKIDRIKKRICCLKTEIAMGNYYDGWTLIGLKNEFKCLVKELNKTKFNENR